MTHLSPRAIMRPLCVLLASLLLTATTALPGQATPNGPHPVGFTQRWLLDSTRSYRYADSTGGVVFEGPRPLLMNVWYPAARGGGTAVTNADHFTGAIAAARSTPGLTAFATAMAAHHRRTAIAELTRGNPDSLDASLNQAVREWLAASTPTRRDAPRLPGRLPLVIYVSGAGSSYDDNAATCAFLASHGYVVVSSGWQRGNGSGLATHGGPGAVEGDVRSLVVAAARWYGADWSRVGAIGHSAGAHALVRLQSEGTSPVRTALILDTTQDPWPLIDDRWAHNYLDAVRTRAPVASGTLVFITDPLGQFQVGDTLSGAERWYVTLPHLNHNDYITQGIAGRVLRERAARLRQVPAEDSLSTATRRVHDFLNTRILGFLDATLRDNAAARATLSVPLPSDLGGTQSRVEYRARGQSAPPAWEPAAGPPTPGQWRRALQGPDQAAAFRAFAEVWRRDSTPPVFQSLVAVSLIYERLLASDSLGARSIYRGYGTVDANYPTAIIDRFMSWGATMAAVVPDEPEYAARWYRAVLALEPQHAKASEGLRALKVP